MNKLWFVVFLCLTILGLIFVGLLTGYYTARGFETQPDDYAIVFDAGSSGTRMYIYKWKSGFSASRGDELIITEDFSCITKDNGIDKIKSKDELIDSFTPCMTEASNIIPKDRKSRTYILLAATAGMRLLELQNQTKSETVLNYIREYFSSTNYLYKDSSQVKILSGRDEGTNGWISANYFLNSFKPNANTSDTVGVLDLGGASTQIVYIPEKANLGYSYFFDQLKIYSTIYQPYTYSYLCRGVNQANLMYRAYLLNLNNFTKSTAASCFPINSTIISSASEFINSPCTNSIMFGFSYNFTIDPTILKPSDEYTFYGTSDNVQCAKEIAAIIPKYPCYYTSCSFDNVYQPNIGNGVFYAISGYYYTFNNTASIVNGSFDNNLDGFNNASNYICSKSLNELEYLNNITHSDIKPSFLTTLCFTNNYAMQLWKNYGFKDLTRVNIVDEIDGYTVGWTLGYLINHLNRDDFLPYEMPPRKLPSEFYIPFVVFGSVFTAIFFILFLIYGVRLRCYIKKNVYMY